jgi:proteasome lid subunit RPN8/RPN11
MTVIKLTKNHLEEILSHASEQAPYECCGLIGGDQDGHSISLYRARNIAPDPLVAYEAHPEDLFAAQRTMRAQGEQLIAIYHSHPRSADPQPSATDVRLAYYPHAVYFIVGLGSNEPCLRAFHISERENRWRPAEFEMI